LKRRSLVLTVVAGLLVFLVVLALYLPASWFASMLPAQVRCAELGGSIWHGECLGLTLQGTRLGDATWNLAPTGALRGRAVGDVQLAGTALTGRADVSLGRDGAGELRNLTARVPMDPAVLPQFPRDQRGDIQLALSRVELASGGVPRLLEGTVELRDFRQLSPQPAPLGSYRLTLDGRVQPDGSIIGQLQDIDGPFSVHGTVTFTPPNRYVGQGTVSGRTPEAREIVRQITFGAPADAQGGSPFTFENTF
jgi:hypothetical protein